MGQRHAPTPPYPRERPGTHCTGGWVGFRAGLDRCGKSRPHRDSIPAPSGPQTVAIPTTLPGCHNMYHHELFINKKSSFAASQSTELPKESFQDRH